MAFINDNKQARYSQGYVANRIEVLTGSETKTKSASDSTAFLALQTAHSKAFLQRDGGKFAHSDL